MIKTVTVAPNLMHDYMYPVLNNKGQLPVPFALPYWGTDNISDSHARINTCILDASFNLT